jgi:ketosteroid isomerase-like protein
MQADEHGDDVQAIEAVIVRQFASLSWTPGTSADWDRFVADFFPEASLYPAARPAKRQTIEAFIERMKDLEGTKLRSFEEAVLGTEIHVFGNVAVAVAVCEMTENGAEVHRGVEMLLLIKNAGAWQIVSQAWDTESPSQPIPMRLLGGAAGE